MKEISNSIIASILTTFIFLLGGIDIALISLLIIIVLDYVTGILSAFYNKQLSSKIGYKGIIKKVSYFIIIMVAVLLDRLLGETNLIRTFMIYYFVANEGLSIIENVGEMGIKLPKKLLDALEQLKNKGSE